MANSLTAGFDFAEQISEKAIEEIIQGYHGSGTISSLATKSFQSSQGPATMEIYFGLPKLKFISQSGLSNPICITFPFVLRLSHDNQEYNGNAAVVVSTAKESVIVGSEEAVVITIDFSGYGDHLFEFSTGLWASSFPPEFDSEVIPVIANNLRAVSTKLQVSSALVHGTGFFTAQSYVHPGDNSFLGVFVNKSNVEQSAPDNMKNIIGWIYSRKILPR